MDRSAGNNSMTGSNLAVLIGPSLLLPIRSMGTVALNPNRVLCLNVSWHAE